MPGKRHGRNSLEGPTKETYMEGEVYDDGGDPQGTVVLWVKRLFAPGDREDSAWGRGDCSRRAVTMVDGAYHICKGPPADCKGGT